MNKARNLFYWLARLIGDVHSLRSPETAIKRVVRKAVYRKSGGFINKILK